MSEQKIYKAIVDTMKEIGAIGKKDRNEFDKYMFRGIDAVYNALQPAMVKNGIFVTPMLQRIEQTDRLSRKGESMIHTRVEVLYTFFAEDGSFIKVVVPGEAMDRSDKSANKAMSAAFKYACFQTFCIPTEEMKDADSESPDAGKKAPGVNPDLVPHGEGMTDERIAKLHAELERTGWSESKISAKVGASVKDWTEAQYIAAMNGLAKIANKGE